MIAALDVNNADDAQEVREKLLQQVKLAEELEHPELSDSHDVGGVPLDPEKVFEARMKEPKFTNRTRFDDIVEVAECWQNTGKAQISKWYDINMGDHSRPNYRSRNVAREIAYKQQDGLFAATPLLGVMDLPLSAVASGNEGERLMVADVKCAYFRSECKRLTYVKLSPGDMLPGEEDMCGRLDFSMYGTSDAAANLAEECTEKLRSMELTAGKTPPRVFYRARRGFRTYVHGGDCVGVGMPSEFEWVQDKMKHKYELKEETLGPDEGRFREVRVLDRVLRWKDKAIEYDADPRHVEIIPEQLHITDCKLGVTAGIKEEGRGKPGNMKDSKVEERVDQQRHGLYRALVERANYLSVDRPDVTFAVKELARGMISPCSGDWGRLRCLARHLQGRPRVVKTFAWQKPMSTLSMCIDADWAGDKESRKSTWGGCIMVGQHLLKGRARTQTMVALSSGESELYATYFRLQRDLE